MLLIRFLRYFNKCPYVGYSTNLIIYDFSLLTIHQIIIGLHRGDVPFRMNKCRRFPCDEEYVWIEHKDLK